MVLRKITYNKKEYFMDEFFNIYADKDKKEHKGVFQVRTDEKGARSFYISPKVVRTKASLDKEDEYDEFWAARKLFNAMMSKGILKKKEKPAEAPKPAAPKRKIKISDEPELDLDKTERERMEEMDEEIVRKYGEFLTPAQQREKFLLGIPTDSGVFAKKKDIVWDPRTNTHRAPTESEREWMAANPGLGLEYMNKDEDFPEE